MMHLLFDLDGTLTDSRDGITRCYRHALVELGYPVPADQDIAACIGPPLATAFATFLRTSDPDLIERAIALYRQRFASVGMFENRLYPGVTGMLQACVAMGHTLSVVTAKPTVYANPILEHFGLLPFFRSVHGSDLTDRATFAKARLIHEARVASATPLLTALMIGDRADDVLSARTAGVASVAVAWGYAEPGELDGAQPDHLAQSPEELVDCVRRYASNI